MGTTGIVEKCKISQPGVPISEYYPIFLLKIFFNAYFWSDFQIRVYLIKKCGLGDHGKSNWRFYEFLKSFSRDYI